MSVWVIGEQQNGKLLPITLELIHEGRILAKDLGTELGVAVAGSDIENETRNLIPYGADEVAAIDSPLLGTPDADLYAEAVVSFLRSKDPQAVLMCSTYDAREYTSIAAAELDSDLLTDCIELRYDETEKAILATRPSFDGKGFSVFRFAEGRKAFFSVRPGIMTKQEPVEGSDPKFEVFRPDLAGTAKRVTVSDRRAREKSDGGIVNAKLIVCGGRGMRDEAGFELLYQLADRLRGEVGCSRPCVDAGLAPLERQIGQSGSTVAPDIYIGFGVSGAVQHLMGFRRAKNIIAVNKDRRAPIFRACDYGVVGDAHSIIKRMIEYADRDPDSKTF